MHLRSFVRTGLIVSAALAACLAGATAQAQSAHHQAGSNPLVSFDTPIYPGFNNGFAYAPVGATTQVHLRYLNQAPYGWNADVAADMWLYKVQNEALGDHTCSGTPGAVHIGSAPALDGTGSATITFTLPLSATQASGPDFGACVHQSGAATPYIFSNDLDSFNGHVYIYNNNPPSLSVSPSAVHRGGTVTVSGHNWGFTLAGDSDTYIGVAIGHCNSGGSLGGTTVTSLPSSGNFSVSFTIPSGAAFGSVQACAASAFQHIDNLSGSDQTPPVFTILAPAAPTPTPVPATPVPAATATPAPSATPVPTPTPGSGSGGGGPCSRGILGLAGMGMCIVFVARRKQFADHFTKSRRG